MAKSGQFGAKMPHISGLLAAGPLGPPRLFGAPLGANFVLETLPVVPPSVLGKIKFFDF